MKLHVIRHSCGKEVPEINDVWSHLYESRTEQLVVNFHWVMDPALRHAALRFNLWIPKGSDHGSLWLSNLDVVRQPTES